MRLVPIILCLLASSPALGAAPRDVTLGLQARFFDAEAGAYGDDLFKDGDTPQVAQADQLPYGEELLLVVSVDGEPSGLPVTLVAKQGKRVEKRSAKRSPVAQGKSFVALHVTYGPCEPLVLTVSVGSRRLVRTIDFVCGE